MCKDCLQSSHVPMVLVSDEPEYTPKRHRGALGNSICDECPMLELCRKRVGAGGHCYCEILTEDDLLIMALEVNDGTK